MDILVGLHSLKFVGYPLWPPGLHQPAYTLIFNAHWRARCYPPYTLTKSRLSVLVFFLWQHYYKAGEGPGEGGAPAERDLCGLCTLSVAYPAGQPRTGAAHWRYRCWIVQAVCGVMSPAPCRCMYSAGCLNDGCVRSCRCWQESHYFAHKLGVCQSLIKSALPFIHLVTSLCFVFFMNLSTYWVLFLDVVFLNISVSKSHQMSCGNVKIIGSFWLNAGDIFSFQV